MSEQINGLVIAERFYHEVVQPILDAEFRGVSHSAGRLDFGSDTLGFDDATSRDHGWGPHFQLFLRDDDYDAHAQRLIDVLGDRLPFDFLGYSTNFEEADWQPRRATVRPIQHKVVLTTVARFCRDHLAQPTGRPPETTIDWLTIPSQRLRALTCGRVIHDGLGILAPLQQAMAWYPHDVWLYLLASQWRRIEQEEPFMARCGDVGDEIGSRLVASRQINEIMRLCFLMERQYPPYYKWFGKAFSRLVCAEKLTPVFHRVLDAADWRSREECLSHAHLAAAEQHNALKLTDPQAVEMRLFQTRPYRVLAAGRFVEALRQAIVSPEVQRLPLVGAVWQFADSTDVLDDVARLSKLRHAYAR